MPGKVDLEEFLLLVLDDLLEEEFIISLALCSRLVVEFLSLRFYLSFKEFVEDIYSGSMSKTPSES